MRALAAWPELNLISAGREVAGSNPGRINTQRSLKITEENVLPLL